MIIIPELGCLSLIIAFMLACLLGKSLWMQSHQHTVALLWSKTGFIVLGFLTLVLCFLQNNFSVAYVALNSNTHLPLIYKFCAAWGAHEGSLLLWIVMLSLWTLLLIPLKQFRPIAIISLISAGFLFILLHTSNPFIRALPDYPVEGMDLNPLLQDPGFVIHPPILYMGYVGFAIPFAFSIAALIQQDRTLNWVRFARPFALMAWAFLTVGIILGSGWAYYELGWGGWWFWDPVENASLMPWLIGGALCHALMLASKRGQYQNWCHVLAMMAFILSLMGTFLVRSGMISSVHAFASDPKRGVYILLFLSSVIVASFVLYILRAGVQEKENVDKKAISFFSKESGILLGNVIFIVMTFTVLLGTLYPLAMEVLFEKRMSVGQPYFRSIFGPLVGILLILMSVVPYIHWDKDRWVNVFLRLRWPLVAFLIGGLIFFIIMKQQGLAYLGVLLAIGLMLFTIYRLILTRTETNWGMVVSHFGLAFSMIGMILVNALEIEKEMPLAIGDSVQVGNAHIQFQSLHNTTGSNYEGRRGVFSINENGKIIGEIYPEKRYFPARESVMTESAILAGFFKDYYIALGDKIDDLQWSVRIYVKPFVRWIWIGGFLIAFGAFYSGYYSWKHMRKSYVNK